MRDPGNEVIIHVPYQRLASGGVFYISFQAQSFFNFYRIFVSAKNVTGIEPGQKNAKVVNRTFHVDAEIKKYALNNTSRKETS